ncbi:MAG: 16S rRNA (guanine(966)-N(2))-methyltransferase RsmD [Alphaproteobacteria bacterium]|nr:16S rRNA (guanine(966)-N(2))-methyltransferase RsmD [Alphaproteobacteria bacterium]
MKISGGKYRGKKLFSPQSEEVRPTSDRMREAVFNILRSRLGFNFSNKVFFDVFAGSGAMGLEALSQGFNQVFFFDKDTTTLQKNVKLFAGEEAHIHVISGNVLQLRLVDMRADVLFMDAPYNKGLTEDMLQKFALEAFLNDGALCLIEVEKNEKCILPSSFELLDERRYGLAKLIIAKFTA